MTEIVENVSQLIAPLSEIGALLIIAGLAVPQNKKTIIKSNYKPKSHWPTASIFARDTFTPFALAMNPD